MLYQFFVDSGIITDSVSVDTYTHLLMHMDGADGAVAFTDEKGNAVTNATSSFDTYTLGGRKSVNKYFLHERAASRGDCVILVCCS